MKKLTRKIESKASGATASSAKASSGPSIAPVVSSARWTPNAAPSCALGRRERDHRVARGRADALADAVDEHGRADADSAVPTVASRSLQTAERP